MVSCAPGGLGGIAHQHGRENHLTKIKVCGTKKNRLEEETDESLARADYLIERRCSHSWSQIDSEIRVLKSMSVLG